MIFLFSEKEDTWQASKAVRIMEGLRPSLGVGIEEHREQAKLYNLSWAFFFFFGTEAPCVALADWELLSLLSTGIKACSTTPRTPFILSFCGSGFDWDYLVLGSHPFFSGSDGLNVYPARICNCFPL